MEELISYLGAASEHTVQYESKLAGILKAAARVMAREGYERASMRRIAKEAGVGLSNLYYYVADKEDLLFQIQYHTFSALVERLGERMAETADPTGRLHLMVKNHLDHFLAHMDELKVCSRELESLDGSRYEKVLRKRREYASITRGIIESLAGPAGANADVNMATMCLFGMLNWIYMWYVPGKHGEGDELARALSTLFLKGFVRGGA